MDTPTKDPNRPIDWDALQLLVAMGKAGTFSPAEIRIRVAMIINA